MKTKSSTVNKTTAPAANTVLASLALPASSAGQTYELTISVALYGAAPAAADAGNIQLRQAGTALYTLPLAPWQNNLQQFKYRVRIPAAGATVDLQAIGAGTASVVYMTQISADSGQQGG